MAGLALAVSARGAAERPVRWAAIVTIQDLGSIGELVAAIATIVTLLYLALQLRENTAAIRGEARRAHRSAANAVNLAIGTDAAVSALFNAGLRNFEALSPDQHTQFAFLMATLVSAYQAAYEEVESGILTESHSAQIGHAIGTLLETPGGRKWWATYAASFPIGFREYVDNEFLGSSGESAA